MVTEMLYETRRKWGKCTIYAGITMTRLVCAWCHLLSAVRPESADRSNVGGCSTLSIGYMCHPSGLFSELVGLIDSTNVYSRCV
jgi:hypothetical protein